MHFKIILLVLSWYSGSALLVLQDKCESNRLIESCLVSIVTVIV